MSPSLKTLTRSVLALALLASTTAACGSAGLAAAQKDEIKTQLRAHRAAYLGCYDAALQRNRAVEGKLVLDLVASERGRLSAVTVAKNATGDKALAKCVVAALRRVSLPPRLPGRVFMTYPLRFAKAGTAPKTSGSVYGRVVEDE